jgi:hypothetical protein
MCFIAVGVLSGLPDDLKAKLGAFTSPTTFGGP